MILWFSLIACVLASLYLPMLGQQVLKHRIIFIDLALAQVAAVGYAIGIAADGNGLMYAALVTIIAILIIAYLPEKTDVPKEGVMGAMYAVATSVGMIVLANVPHAEGQMMALLFGSMLGVDEKELFTLAATGLVAVILIRYHRMDTYLGRVLFYTSIAIAVVPAIYSLGVVLVFSLLVIPGLAVWHQGHMGNSWLAMLIAAAASTAGVFMSNYYDYPPSSAVIVSLASMALISKFAIKRIRT